MTKVRSWISCWACAAAATLLAPAAHADDFVDQANARYKQVGDARRSDLILLPLLGKLEEPPAVVPTPQRAALFGSEGPGFAELAAWAQKPPQKAVLEALPGLVKETDHRRAMVFAQPYGVEGIDLDLVSAELYTELGEPPTLAAAEIGFADELERMGILVHVEASRLAHEGNPNAAVVLLTDWTLFCRQYADRELLKEVRWALRNLEHGLERIRDILYQDYQADTPKVTPETLQASLARLIPSGYVSLDRLQLPKGDIIARRQLLNRVLVRGGGVNQATFGPTMARVSASERPLRIFSASSYWDAVGASHKNFIDSDRALTGIERDWERRWALSAFDPIQQTKTDYALKVQREPNLAAVGFELDGMEELFSMRQMARTELAGTRMSMAVYAYKLREKVLPPALNSARPAIITVIDKDPYSQRNADIQYLRVAVDFPRGPDGKPQPYTIRLYPPDPYPSFEVSIPTDQFLIYSIGPDGIPQRSQNATQGRPGVPGDYLLWPPPVSLYRQRMLDTGMLN